MDVQFEIKTLGRKDENTVRKFLEDNYFPNDPVLIAMGVKEVDEDQVQHILNFLDNNYSYCAVSNDGEIMGVLLCGEVDTTHKGGHLKEEKAACKSVYFRKLIDWYIEIASECKLLEITGMEKGLELHIASVATQFRQRGIMKALFAHVMNVAKYQLLVCTCASKYTSKLCQSLNWECIYCLPYSYYKDSEGNRLFPIPEKPHLHLRICVYVNDT